MSNNPSSRVVMRIQPAALVFLVMILVLGALLLASSNLDPKALQRPQFSATPIDLFAFKVYTPWKSSNGLIALEYPDSWQPQPDPQGNPFSYYFVPAGGTTAWLNVAMYRLTQPLTPEAAINQLVGTPSPDQSTPVTKPVTIAGLKGMSARQHIVTADQSGQRVARELDVVTLALDSTHLLIVEAVSTSDDWPKMQPIVEHALNTLKVDAAGSIKALDAAAATPQATAPATQPAGAPATQPAMPATAVATQKF